MAKRTAYAAGMEGRRQEAIKRRKQLAATHGTAYAHRFLPGQRPAVGAVKVPRTMNWNPGTEVKQADIANLQLVPGTVAAPAFQVLNIIATGAGPTQRVGRKINLLSYSYQGSFQMNPAATVNTFTPDAIIRFVVVYDRQPDPAGNIPPWKDIYQDIDTSGGVLSTAYSNRNPNNID